MARGRMLSAAIAEDIEFNSMSLEAQYLFMRSIPFLDRDGLINGHPSILFGRVASLMPQLASFMAQAIQEWIDAGLVIHYTSGKNQILFFKGFSKNQPGMRYDREGPSSFPPPPGYQRKSDGLHPVEELPVQTKADETPADKTDAQIDSGATPAELRSNSGPIPLEVKDQDQYKESSTREPAQPEAKQYNPSLSQIRHKSNERSKSAEHVKEAKALGLTPTQFTANTDALLEGFNKKALVDAGDDAPLHYTQEIALILARMSEAFRTVDGINSIFESWKKNDYRGDTTPTSTQFKEHASLMVSGKVVCTRKAPTVEAAAHVAQPVDFKRWLLNTYTVDNPKFLDIPRAVLDERYARYQQQQQQAH